VAFIRTAERSPRNDQIHPFARSLRPLPCSRTPSSKLRLNTPCFPETRPLIGGSRTASLLNPVLKEASRPLVLFCPWQQSRYWIPANCGAGTGRSGKPHQLSRTIENNIARTNPGEHAGGQNFVNQESRQHIGKKADRVPKSPHPLDRWSPEKNRGFIFFSNLSRPSCGSISFCEKSPHQSSDAVSGKCDSKFETILHIENDRLGSVTVAFSRG
jgi:hypothetical protein